MSLTHPASTECTKSELDLFSGGLIQLSIQNTNYVEITPLNAIADQEVLEFLIPGNGERYLDLNSTLLNLRLKIVNADGSNLGADDPVGITNYILNSLFSQVSTVKAYSLKRLDL